VELTEPMPEILVVEDEEEVRDVIAAALTGTGFQVHTAATAWEALAILDEREFDVVIADIRLPGGLNGLEMAQDARSRHPQLKFLFISGGSEPVVSNPRLDEFVAKPFRPNELVGCVWKLLHGNPLPPHVSLARR
jgi:CheY-like chemotaxis protein